VKRYFEPRFDEALTGVSSDLPPPDYFEIDRVSLSRIGELALISPGATCRISVSCRLTSNHCRHEIYAKYAFELRSPERPEFGYLEVLLRKTVLYEARLKSIPRGDLDYPICVGESAVIEGYLKALPDVTILKSQIAGYTPKVTAYPPYGPGPGQNLSIRLY
jgi:hypothetical protein